MREPAWQDQFDKAQSTRRVNVVCMKWGTMYGPEWVNRLYGMVARNTTWTIRFVCFTDDRTGIRPEVECQPMPEVKVAAKVGKRFPKLGLMRKGLGGLEGMTLFLDLDVVVIGSLDPFLAHPGRFCIIREWKDPHLGYGNSSVVRWFVGMESDVLDRLADTSPEDLLGKFGGKEQNFISKTVPEVTFWPEQWCLPFAHACLPENRVRRFFATPRKPPEGKILVFFGAITPASAIRGEHEQRKRAGKSPGFRPVRRRFRPAPWIAEYWRE